ncbi:TPA: phage holin family protein [Enterococcus faecalis]|uniref:phage holin family protein n=1 Tax=Enterococcus faecalis TaxID=1351 RepID=UPI000DFF70E4|nr:phage holin family protein [Enterococcus faecalis]STP98012.1 Predicted membrane protein [Enterococcus faecalis]HAP5241002.1 phage holin family protein [Enterococcus faecalis]
MTYFQRLVVNTLTFISLSVVFPGMIHVRGIMPAIIAAFVLSILNMLVKPVLTILSLPFTLLTFGLFSFVVNEAILQMTSFFVGEMNFGFSSFWAAVLMAVIMSIVNTIVTDHNLSKYE